MLLHFLVPCLPSNPFPGVDVLSNSCIKVTKNGELVCGKNSKDNIFKVFVELFFCLIHVGYGGCIGAVNGSKLFPVMKWKSYSYDVVIYSLDEVEQAMFGEPFLARSPCCGGEQCSPRESYSDTQSVSKKWPYSLSHLWAGLQLWLPVCPHLSLRRSPITTGLEGNEYTS